MNTLEISNAFFNLVQQVKENEKLKVLAFDLPEKIDAESLQAIEKAKLPDSVFSFLQSYNGFRLHWENAVQATTLISGNLCILPAKEVVKDWNDAIYFDDATSAAKKQFYPVDQFSDEACCGVFSGKNENLHYYAFSSGEEPYDLKLTIEPYISIAIAAKCYYYWPLILKLIIEKTDSPMIQKMNDDMAVLFPEFSMENWVEAYKKLKTKK